MPKIKISPISVLWITFLIASETSYLLPTVIAVALHELGHIIAARILKIRISSLEITILGARMETVGEISYKKEFLFALGGPLFGALTFAVCYPLRSLPNVFPPLSDFFLFLSLISLALALFNLIPLPSLDGSRLIKCLLKHLLPLDTAERIMRIIGFFSLFTLWLFSAYLVIKTSGGLEMLIFCAIFFAKSFIFDNEKRDF